MRVDGLLFDKDGTLFDFRATWDVWGGQVISDIADGDPELIRAIAASIDYDLDRRAFLPVSRVIAGTNREAAESIADALPGADVDALEERLSRTAANAPLSPAVPLDPYLNRLGVRGLRLGVMTNDSEYSARTQLTRAGVVGRFDFIAGFDSGHGAKPAPEPLWAFARACGLDPARVAMVGDSAHDLIAGRAAGMLTIGVLTGIALESDLAPLADVVFPDIGHIEAWIG
jgi:phosphoglycolate phosphatase